MKPQQALENTQPVVTEKTVTTPLFVEAETLLTRVEDLTKSIARRAYEFFEARGREIGNEVEDWFRAEAELLRHVPVTMKEDEHQFTMQAEVPGFKAEEIKLSVEPQRLIIEGNSEQAREEKSETEPEKVVFSERRSNRFFRSVTLPAEIDASNVTANLKDGVLEITMPKAPARNAVGVEIKTA